MKCAIPLGGGFSVSVIKYHKLRKSENCMPLCLFALVSTYVPYDFDFNVGALMLQLCCIKNLCMTQSSLILIRKVRVTLRVISS